MGGGFVWPFALSANQCDTRLPNAERPQKGLMQAVVVGIVVFQGFDGDDLITTGEREN